MAPPVPERVRWAVETLSVEPHERILEIGCGPGVATSLVCERLVDGTLLAIDRSATQIERARRRNDGHLASGRLELWPVAVEDVDLDDRLFDTIFAINVNLFWVTDARMMLERVAHAVAPGGSLFLFYEVPGPARAREIANRIAAALGTAGFGEADLLTAGSTLVCARARPELA